MKQIIIITAVIFLPMVAVAVERINLGTIPGHEQIGVEPSPARDVTGLLGIVAGVVQVTYWVFFAIAVMILLLVAFEYLLSRGEPEIIKKAQDWLIYASISIVLGLIAVAASTIIQSFARNPAVSP